MNGKLSLGPPTKRILMNVILDDDVQVREAAMSAGALPYHTPILMANFSALEMRHIAWLASGGMSSAAVLAEVKHPSIEDLLDKMKVPSFKDIYNSEPKPEPPPKPAPKKSKFLAYHPRLFPGSGKIPNRKKS